MLRSAGARRLFIGGLATDYCILNAVGDGLRNGYQVYVVKEAIRAVNVHPDNGEKARQAMIGKGDKPIPLDVIH